MSLYIRGPQPPAQSPRRQPVSSIRKAVDLLPRKFQTQEPRVVSSVDWSSVSFADIPTTALDHVLREVFKGMLFESTNQVEELLTSQHQATASNKPQRNVSFEAEPVPQVSGTAESPESVSFSPSVTSVYGRVQAAYTAILEEVGMPTDDSVLAATTTRSFSSTLSSLSDRRLRQYESMLHVAREEVEYVNAQLDDLRKAHDQVHQELNRSYRQYDVVQRQLLTMIAKEKARTDAERRSTA